MSNYYQTTIDAKTFEYKSVNGIIIDTHVDFLDISPPILNILKSG